MPRTPVRPLLLALLLVLLTPVAAHAGTVGAELASLRDQGLIGVAEHDAWRAGYTEARRTRSRLRGARRAELTGVIDDVEHLAETGQLTAERAPLAFETLERNRRWWPTGRLLGWGARVAMSGSPLVWQAYPGRGLQVTWIGTWGRANGLWSIKKRDALRELVDEALRHAAPRAGGLGFEYRFTLYGAPPPWVSGIAQGTAVQALVRAAALLKEPRYLEAAKAAMRPLAAAPPEGLRVEDHLLMYSFDPELRILNGFVQALNGIHDLATATGDPEAQALFAAGETRLRTELPAYDTGAWSLYRPGKEADLGYHVLVRDVLRGLCGRLGDAGAVYCETATKYTQYLRTSPRVALVPGTLRRRRAGAIRIRLDKVSTVTLTVRREGEVVLRRTARLERGRRSFPVTPRSAKPLAVEVRAVDLAGNVGTTSGEVRVRPT